MKIILYPISIILIIVEVLILLLWFPKYVKYLCAKLFGKRYDGELIKSYSVYNKGLSSRTHPYVFILQVKAIVDDQKKVLEFGKFIEYPNDFFPEDNRCTIYYYAREYFIKRERRKRIYKIEKNEDEIIFENILNGEYTNKDVHSLMKYHIEDLEQGNSQESNNPYSEWLSFSLVKSKHTFIFPPFQLRMIVDGKPNMVWHVYIEVRGKSKKAYSGDKLEDILKLEDMIRMYFIKSIDEEKQLVNNLQYRLISDMNGIDGINISEIHISLDTLGNEYHYYPWIAD